MKKKLIILIAIILIIILAIVGSYLVLTDGGTKGIASIFVPGSNVSDKFMTLEKKTIAQECVDFECFQTNFLEECNPSFGEQTTEDGTMTLYVEIAGKEEGKCRTNIRLISAEGEAKMAEGLEASCLLTEEEIMALESNPNISTLDCEGQLYEAAKLVQ